MTMTTRREKLKDKEYRAGFAESFLDTSIATQIRVLREQRDWTQAQLAHEAGMKQSRISALENADYSKWSIGTLKRLARAFDVPLNVAFGTFGKLLVEVDQFGRASLERPEFAKDPAILREAHTTNNATTGTSTLSTSRSASVGTNVVWISDHLRKRIPVVTAINTTAAASSEVREAAAR